MANVIIRKVDLTLAYQALTPERTVGTFTIISPGTSNNIRLLTDDLSGEVSLGRGDKFTLERIDLSQIIARGDSGDFLIIIGATVR